MFKRFTTIRRRLDNNDEVQLASGNITSMARSEHISNGCDVVALHPSFTSHLHHLHAYLHACDSAISGRSPHLVGGQCDLDQAYTSAHTKQ